MSLGGQEHLYHIAEGRREHLLVDTGALAKSRQAELDELGL